MNLWSKNASLINNGIIKNSEYQDLCITKILTSLTKKPHPQAKIFFQVQARRLAASFQAFTGSVEHTRFAYTHAYTSINVKTRFACTVFSGV